MARISQSFDGLPYDVFAALTPLVKDGNQDDLIKRFLDAWHRSPYSRFHEDEDPSDRELAESRLITYAKLWAAMQAGPTDGETQHG